MILCTVVYLFSAPAGRFAETSLDAYKKLQERLARVKSIQIEFVPTTGNSWDRELIARIQRPNRASLNGFSNYWKTDGRWTFQDDDNGKLDRRYKKGDLLHLWLPGFESFYDPRAQVSDLQPPRILPIGGKETQLIYVKINGHPWTLFLDRESRLPNGYSSGTDQAHPQIAYYKVVLNPKFPPETFSHPRKRR